MYAPMTIHSRQAFRRNIVRATTIHYKFVLWRSNCKSRSWSRCASARHFAQTTRIGQTETRRTLCAQRFPLDITLAIPARDFIQALRIGSSQPDELKRAFGCLDLDSSGALSASELKTFIKNIKGYDFSEEEVDEAVQHLLCRFDTGEDGELSFAEFEKVVIEMASHVDNRAYALAASIGVAFSCFSLTFPMAPMLIQTFNLTQFQFGTLTTAFAISKLCGNIPASILSEKYGRKPLLVGGLVCISIGLGGLAMATCYEQLLLLRLGVGLGVASTFTAAGMYITDISHPLNSARSRAPMQMGMGVGMLMGPALGGFLLENVGLNLTAFGVGAASFTTAMIVSNLLPESLEKAMPGTSSAKSSEGVYGTLKSWGPMLEDHKFRTILSWGWCYNAAFWGGMSLLPLLYVDLGLSPLVVGSISTANAVVSLAATPLVASTADRFGKTAVVVPGGVLYGAGLLLVPQASSIQELLPVLAAMQVGAAMCGQAQIHAMDTVPARDRAKVPGLWNTFSDSAMLISSLLSASLAQAATTGTAFAADGTLLIIATTLLFGFARYSRK